MVLEVGQQFGREEEVSARAPTRATGSVAKTRGGGENAAKANALSHIGLGRRLDESIVHVALHALVHALVDLVDESKGGLGELGQGHEVHDGREGAFLWECESARRVALVRGKADDDSLLPTGDAKSTP